MYFGQWDIINPVTQWRTSQSQVFRNIPIVTILTGKGCVDFWKLLDWWGSSETDIVREMEFLSQRVDSGHASSAPHHSYMNPTPTLKCGVSSSVGTLFDVHMILHTSFFEITGHKLQCRIAVVVRKNNTKANELTVCRLQSCWLFSSQVISIQFYYIN